MVRYMINDKLNNINYKKLNELGLLEPLEKILSYEAIIDLDEEDLKLIADNRLKGYYYGSLKDIKINILDNDYNKVLFVAIGDENLTIEETKLAVKKTREELGFIELSFSSVLNNEIKEGLAFILVY